LLEHRPEDDMASGDIFTGLRGAIGVLPSTYNPQPDPQNLERARKIWLEQADSEGRPAAVYYHAYQFFTNIDKPVAEQMLLRAQGADPKGDVLQTLYSGSWSACLGDFYARLLTVRKFVDSGGPENPLQAFIAQAYGPLDPASPFEAEIRKKLESSKDITLLLSAASPLVLMGGAPPSDLDYGESLIKRALSLQPTNSWGRQLLNSVTERRTIASLPGAVWEGSLDSRHQAIERLATGERFRELTNLAVSAGDQGMYSRSMKNESAAKAAWQRAGGYAKEAMDLAPQARSHPDYGTAFFNANMVLGMAAVEAGDAKTGANYLLKAADAPVTDALRYPIPNAWPWRTNWQFPSVLEAALLKAGERDAVITFLKRYSEIAVSDRDRCL